MMKRQLGGKEKKNVETSHISSIGDVQRNSMFGKYSEAEIIFQLKALSVDPCSPQFTRNNIQAFWDQIVKLRKVMALKDSELPCRKRKLEQFVKDKLRPPPFVSANKENMTKMSRKRSSHASPTSCLLNSIDSTLCLDEKISFHSRASGSLLTFEYSLMDETVDFSCLRKNTHPGVDSNESIEGSNQLSPESFPNLETSNKIQCLSDGARSGSSQHSMRLLNYFGNRSQRKVVPVGLRFQADVPDWTGPTNGPNNSKWLGTQVWPAQTEVNIATRKAIGKGRLDSCSCGSHGSADCVKRHVLKEKQALQCDLGPVFSIWKFDEMGEQVAESWSLKEQRRFESLWRMKLPSNGKSFLKRALKCFPNKSGKDIVSYYFNVYIPRRMNLHSGPESTRQVDTDDDETEFSNYLGVQKKSPVKSNSKDVKGRYLRRIP